MITVKFDGTHVGLIVRGKHSESHEPALMAQHADCILSDGSPIGYFGNDGPGSGQGLQPLSGLSSAWSNSSGMNMQGFVADHRRFLSIRPYYVDISLARKYGIISTVLLIEVSSDESRRFEQFWRDLKTNPGTFNILGHNCSTHASKAFRYAGIIAAGIPGLDTPSNLYRQLRRERAATSKSYSGYVGFELDVNGFQLLVKPITNQVDTNS